ncbi:PilZ domain-containing protein [Pseudaeromonas paramecii]|uniref:PilZ domain-containing protein n=1 Tax=Pseudaeromonas paramecii TaxID=2138166 RepID=A0ABP8QFI9_9GAMM
MLDHNQERRTFMRMVVDAPVCLIQGAKRVDGICRDLSATGMAIELPEDEFAVGDRLYVSLATSSNALPPFQAEAKVLRVEADGHLFRLGVEFITIT